MSMAPTSFGSLGLDQDLLPGRAAVGGAEDAAFGIGVVDVAERGDVDAIRVRRIHHDAADLSRAVEADMGPGLAGVGGFEHADAVGVLAADIGLAGADIDDVRVRGRHRNGADGADGDALIADGKPGAAGVFGLPDAAADGAEIKGVGLVGIAGDAITCVRRAWVRRRASAGRRARWPDTEFAGRTRRSRGRPQGPRRRRRVTGGGIELPFCGCS